MNLNQSTSQGVTPATIAADQGHTQVLSILVEAKSTDGKFRVDLNRSTIHGCTASYIAADHVTKILSILAAAVAF